MVAITFNHKIFFFFIITIYTTLYLSMCYQRFINNYINLNVQKLKVPELYSWFFFDFILIYSISNFIFFTNKSLCSDRFVIFHFFFNFILLFFLIFIFFIIMTNNKINLIYFITLSCMYIISFLLEWVDNLISFLLILEIYSVLYYFFFILKKYKKKISIKKYKNLLLIYIWNSFLITSIYVIGCIFLFVNYNTLEFDDLIRLYNYNSYNIGTYCLISSLGLKLSLPGYHWLKLEIYSYLNNSSIFFYTIFTLLINFFLIFFITFKFLLFLIFSVYNIFLFLFLLLIIILSNNLKLYNFLYFFAYSSIITLTMFLIIVFL